MPLGTAHHRNQHPIVAFHIFRRVVAGIVAGILIKPFLSYLLHLRRSANHCMVIHVIGVAIILDEKPCHNIRTLPDLFNNDICISDSKFPNFLLSILLAFIADV